MQFIRKIIRASLPIREAFDEWETIHFGLLNRDEKAYRKKLRESELFDPGHYRQQLSDNLVARVMPFRHFILRGERKNISPGPEFRAKNYFQRNPDVRKLGMPALRHFLMFGQTEGRQIRPPAQVVPSENQPPRLSESEMVTYAHIGAGKCGSSAIQSCLSQHPVLQRKEGGELDYRVICQTGILRGNDVRQALRRLPTGYYPSMTAVRVAEMSEKVFSNAVGAVQRARVPIVFSFESWLHEMSNNPDQRARMMELFSGGGTRKVKLIAYVRPLVKWINSAWWQWGAWTPGIDFDDWLEGALKVDWNRVTRRLMLAVGDDVLTVRPVLGNVVDQLFDDIGCIKPKI